MASKRVPKQFVVDELSKRLYGVQFTKAGKNELFRKVAAETGMDVFHVIMIMTDKAMEEVARKHGGDRNDIYMDDALVHICKELDIDYRQFEHNIAKASIDPLIDLARTTLAHAAPPKNDLQRPVQRSRLYKLWQSWV